MNSSELEGHCQLQDMVKVAADSYGDAPALVGPAGDSLTFAALRQAMLAGAALLRSRFEAGDKLVLLLPSGPSWLVALFAGLEAGMVVVPVSPASSAEVLGSQLAHVDARALVRSSRCRPVGVDLTEVEVEELLHAPMASDRDETPRSADATALLAFTSGCTGSPRAVELSHGNLLSDLRSLLRADRAQPRDVFLSLLPSWHMYELIAGQLAPLACGAAVHYAASPLPNRIVQQLRDQGVTHTIAVPALLEALYSEVLDSLVGEGHLPDERRTQTVEETARRFRTELSSAEIVELCRALRHRIGERLRFVGCGGAAVPSAWEDILPPLGITLGCGYGLTEAGPVVAMGHSGSAPAGSVGRPLPGIDVRISRGGEILVRGPNIMKGYFRDPEASAAALRGGFLHTGDLGHLDRDGNLFFTGRRKEAIVTACGTCLDPAEFDRHYASPHFAEACVTGMQDLGGNDLPTLVVVPFRADADRDELKQEVARLRGAAPAHLRVSRLTIVPGPLPRTSLGKVRRRYLADVLAKGNEQVMEA